MASTSYSNPFVVRPGPRFLLRHPAHLLALGLGSGLSPVAPGTVGSLFGWWLFYAVLGRIDALNAPVAMLGLLGIAFVVGVFACQITGRNLGAPDHGAMVWDEIVAMVLVLALIPRTFWWQFAGFVLFRFFDVLKPAPIRGFERRHKNGFGVMADDILAAFYALLVLALFKAVML